MLRSFFALVCLLLTPMVAVAQTGQAGIAGVVKDTSGAVLPGVTVEASSPALIEKVRTVVTDNEGQYGIVNLRPGVYAVTFSLTGFTTVSRQGIELTSNFTAPVNAELRVGAVEETVTVSGQSPVVDIQNVVQQRVISADVVAALPTARNIATLGSTIPGLIATGANKVAPQDVGGLSGERSSIAIHGGKSGDASINLDNLPYGYSSDVGNYRSVYTINAAEAQEFLYEISAVSIETATGGIRTNVVPKSGGNTFQGIGFANFANSSMQSDNLTDDLRARGLQSVNNLNKLWDLSLSYGGPIKKDKLWFFGDARYWGSNEYVAGMYYDTNQFDNVYIPDLSRQAFDDQSDKGAGLRLTWQATKRNSFGLLYNHLTECQCHWHVSALVAPEASTYKRLPFVKLAQFSWKSTVSNRLLLEAAMSVLRFYTDRNYQPEADRPDVTSITELSTGLVFRSALAGYTAAGDSEKEYNNNYRFALNYVTGSHALKVGATFQRGTYVNPQRVNGAMNLQVFNGVPRSVVVRVSPIEQSSRLNGDLGLYAQDQWKLKHLALNMAVRFDHRDHTILAEHLPAGLFVPARDFPEIPGPNWKDLSPRLGAAYDLFGTGKTALKVSLSKYLEGSSASPIIRNMSPVIATVDRATRVWTDNNGDFLPQENELGPLSDQGFGQSRILTTYDPAFLDGFGTRGYNWETSAGVQHELLPRVSVEAMYFYRRYGNLRATDNVLVTPTDYSPFCVTAPVDARLPGGGGTQLCGFYDINPAKFGQRNDFVTLASNFGNASEVYHGFDLNVNARLPRGGVLAGGLSEGTSVLDTCDVRGKVDDPVNAYGGYATPASPSLVFCRENLRFKPSVKFLGAFQLPWNLQTGVTFQSAPGTPITASYSATNDQVKGTLGRDLAAGPRGLTTVPLIEPGTMFGDRMYQVDLRVGKTVGVNRSRLKMLIDVYNLFNSSNIRLFNTTYGPNWLKPQYILPGRIFKVGAELDF